jgi:hypothetical protein
MKTFLPSFLPSFLLVSLEDPVALSVSSYQADYSIPTSRRVGEWRRYEEETVSDWDPSRYQSLSDHDALYNLSCVGSDLHNFFSTGSSYDSFRGSLGELRWIRILLLNWSNALRETS